MEAGIEAGLVAGLALGGDAQGVIEEGEGAPGSLLAIFFLQGLGLVQKGVHSSASGHQEVSQVGAKRTHEVKGVEALRKHLVEGGHRGGVVPLQKVLHQGETVFIIKDVEVSQHIFALHVGPAESHRLVENGEGVPHGSVGLLPDDVEGLVVDGDAFLVGYAPQVLHHVGYADTVEVVGLAAGEDGGEDLVLLGGREDENRVCGRLFEGLEEGVEGLGGEHVHLVDYIHAVLSDLGRNLHLVHQGLDVVHAVVGGRVQLMDTVGPPFLEGDAGLTFSARLHVLGRIGTVYGLGEDAGCAGLAHSAGSAEKVSMGQLSPQDGILEGPGYVVLADKGLEGVRPVLAS